MDVKGSKINVVRIDGYEYISLTDLAKTQNDEAPADVVKNWLRNKETLSLFLVFGKNLITKILKWSNSTSLKMKQEDMLLLCHLKNG